MNKTKLKAEIKRGKFSNQEERVLTFIIEHKGITSLDAFSNLGVSRLSAVIFNLKKKNVEVTGEFVEVKNRFNEVCRVKRYFIK